MEMVWCSHSWRALSMLDKSRENCIAIQLWFKQPLEDPPSATLLWYDEQDPVFNPVLYKPSSIPMKYLYEIYHSKILQKWGQLLCLFILSSISEGAHMLHYTTVVLWHVGNYFNRDVPFPEARFSKYLIVLWDHKHIWYHNLHKKRQYLL